MNTCDSDVSNLFKVSVEYQLADYNYELTQKGMEILDWLTTHEINENGFVWDYYSIYFYNKRDAAFFKLGYL